MANWGDTRIVEASKDLFILQILYYNHWNGLRLIMKPGVGVVDHNCERGTRQQLTECSYPKRELAEAAQEAYKEYKRIEEKLLFKESNAEPATAARANDKPRSTGFFGRLFGYSVT